MKPSSDKIFIGTMSGTSHDGIDICAIETSNRIRLLNFGSFKYPKKLRTNISKIILLDFVLHIRLNKLTIREK